MKYQAQTGVKVWQVRKATGVALAQLRAESAQSKTYLWWGGTGDLFFQAADPRLLDAYRPAPTHDLHSWAVRQHAVANNSVGGFDGSAVGFGWNEAVLKKRNLPAPKCRSVLLEPKYKGEIEFPDFGSNGTSHAIPARLEQLMGEDAVFNHIKKLPCHITQYTGSGTAQAKSVAKGEVGIRLSFTLASRTNAGKGLAW